MEETEERAIRKSTKENNRRVVKSMSNVRVVHPVVHGRTSRTRCHGGVVSRSKLSNWRDGRNRGSRNAAQINLGRQLAVLSLLRAVARDVASLATTVASLSSRVKRSSVGGRAIPRDVTQLSTGVALHSLSLAVASEVVRATALVAGSRAGATDEASPAAAVAANKAAAGHGHASAHGGADGIWAGALKV